MEPLAGRRVLVTGAAGFLGSHLVPRLIDRGAEVCALDRAGARRWDLIERAGVAASVRADVRSLAEAVHDGVLGPLDTIIHLAAVGVLGEVPDVRELVTTNVDGTVAVLLAARRLRARLIYCGSCFEYGAGARWTEDALPAPTTEYGAAKAAGWLIAQAFSRRTGLELVSLRPFSMYGPMEPPGRLIPSVVRHALAGRPIDLTPGNQARDFVYVEDAADAFIAAATTDTAVGGTFNVCTGSAVTVRDIVRRVLQSTESASIAQFGALSYRPTERPVLSGDPSRAEQILGWRAQVSLDEGLARTIAWFRTVGAGLPEYLLADATTGR
ncbi:MAG: NAD-dependent epimerase/dehydratase family protein [Gemmatimonadaceae bacterium]